MAQKKYLTLDPKDLSQRDLHGYLLGAVAPRPIAFASTINKAGHVNLSPFSFFNVFSSNPPIMIFSPAKRGTDGSNKDTYNNVLEVPEVVINIVNHPIVEQMSLSSTGYDTEVNEFVKAGLTEIPSDYIRAPRVAESPVAFECTVDDIITLGEGGGAGNLIISRVVKIHIDESYLGKDQKIDTPSMDLVGRMGGIWYTRASGSALFQIPKPNRNLGIGVDALPGHVRDSEILSGNDLGRLGNLSQLPSASEIEEAKREWIKENSSDVDLIHVKAKDLIAKGHTEEALTLLKILH